MTNTLQKLDAKITQLKQKREKLQRQQALLLSKEAQRLLGDSFSENLVLRVLGQAWCAASEAQKNAWGKAVSLGGDDSSKPFRPIPAKFAQNPGTQIPKTPEADSQM